MTFHAKIASFQNFVVQKTRLLKFRLFRLDPASRLGVAFLGFAGAILVATLLGPVREAHVSEEETAALQSKLASSIKENGLHQGSLSRALPPRSTREALLKQLNTSAAQQNIELSQLSIQETRTNSPAEADRKGAAKYQISLPATGEYPAIRSWLEGLLSTFPTLAIEEFRLRRESASTSKVEARIRLALYHQDQ